MRGLLKKKRSGFRNLTQYLFRSEGPISLPDGMIDVISYVNEDGDHCIEYNQEQPKQSMSRAVKEKFSEIEKDVEFLKEVAYKGIENGGKLGIVMGYLFDKNRDLFFDLTAMIAERYPQDK